MKRALWFTLKFLAITIPMTWLWWIGGKEYYGRFFSLTANWIYEGVGLESIRGVARERYINYVPFIALMILTPGLELARRWGRLGLGVVLIYVSHLVVNALGPRQGPDWSLPTSLAIVCDALPFVLWAILAREFVGNAVLRALGETPEEPEAPDSA
ncbi:MAG: hypothetical protein AAF430_10955 [Myxococcota bacterium]